MRKYLIVEIEDHEDKYPFTENDYNMIKKEFQFLMDNNYDVTVISVKEELLKDIK